MNPASRTRAVRSAIFGALVSWALVSCGGGLAPSPGNGGGGGNNDGGPLFVINSPVENAMLAAPTYFSVQPMDPGAVSAVRLSAGGEELLVDAPGESQYRVFVMPSDYPDGELLLEATLTGSNGRSRSEAITVQVVADPPGSTTMGPTGAVLGTREENGALSVLSIPPGGAEGVAVAFESRTQDQVKAATGVDYDALGVTFLGAQEINTSEPIEQALAVSSGGFGPMVQPGQAVVQYSIVPNASGKNGLMVTNTASVAPSGDVVSDPLPTPSLGTGSVTSSGQVHALQSDQEALTGAPGTRIQLQAAGFTPYSPAGNIAVFESVVDGARIEVPAYFEQSAAGANPSTITLFMPILPPGPATLQMIDTRTGSATEPVEVVVRESSLLSEEPIVIIRDHFLKSIDGVDNASRAHRLRQTILAFESFAANATAEDEELLNSIGAFITELEANMVQPSASTSRPGAGLATQDHCTPEEEDAAEELRRTGNWQAGMGAAQAIIGGILIRSGNPIAIGIGAELVADGFQDMAEAIKSYSDASHECPPHPPPPEPDPTPPRAPKCTPGNPTGDVPQMGPASSHNARVIMTGMGSAPPAGGPGCGGAFAGSGFSSSVGSNLARANSTSSVSLLDQQTGRFVVEVFVNGRALPFISISDAAGYFFIPFIPEDQPYRAVAMDTVTGETRTVEGTGRPTDVATYLYFDFAPPNSAPVADAGPDQSVGVGASVTLDGSASLDPDGDALSLSWVFDSVPAGSSANLDAPASANSTFTADVGGTYVVRLTVSDGALDSTDFVSITATAAGSNKPPIADVGSTRAVPVPTEVNLDGSNSSDPDGDALTYAWTLDARPSESGATLSSTSTPTTSFVADVVGEYSATLVVSDGELQASDTVLVSAFDDGTVRWDGGGDGSSWQDPLNWDGDVLPSAADKVELHVADQDLTVVHESGNTAVVSLDTTESLTLSGGTLSLEAQSAIDGQVEIRGGTLDGFGAIAVNGLLTWSGGTIRGTGTITLNGGMEVTGSAAKYLIDRTIDNPALVEIQGTNLAGSRGTFNNLPGATLLVAPTGGTGSLALALTNDGTVEARSGTLVMSGVEGSINSGDFIATGTGALSFNNGMELGSSSSITGDGTVMFQSSLVRVAGTYDVTGTTRIDSGTSATVAFTSEPRFGDLELLRGAVAGDGALTVNGAFTWSGGALADAVTVDLRGTGTLEDALLVTGDVTINNSGSINWNGAQITIQGLNLHPTWNNLSGSLLHVQNDTAVSSSSSGNVLALDNAGTLRMSSTNMTSQWRASLVGDGNVEVQAGAVTFDHRGSDDRGTYSGTLDVSENASITFKGDHTLAGVISGAGTIVFDGGDSTLAEGLTYSSDGTLRIQSGGVNIAASGSTGNLQIINGNLAGTGSLTVDGAFTWSGGALVDAVTLNLRDTGSIEVEGIGVEIRDDVTINNSGNVTWTGGGRIIMVGAGLRPTWNNLAGSLFHVQNDADLSSNTSTNSGVLLFNNAGTLRKSTANGTSNWSACYIDEGGTLDLQAGDIAFTGSCP